MYSTGWSQGVIQDSSELRAGWYSVLFSGEKKPRHLKLRKDNYCPFSFAPQGSWCIVERTPNPDVEHDDNSDSQSGSGDAQASGS
jgi:hypothetical protein